MAGTPLRVLIVEDNGDDAELLVLQLRRGGYEPAFVRVDNATQLDEALQAQAWQIVISDYAMPGFSGLEALEQVKTFDRDLPFVLVSGTVGEDIAVQAMRAGASDYIMKDKLTRLVPALERELRDAAERRDRRRTEEALFRERERAAVTLHSIGDAVITTDADGHIDYLNPVAERLTGWTNATATGKPLTSVFKVINEISRKPIADPSVSCLREGRTISLDEQSILVCGDGQERAIEDSAAPIRDRDGTILGVVVVFHDVSQERFLTHQISWQATHDPLTDLNNRETFERDLNDLITESRDSGRHHTLLYLDLDQFKVINDTCGHVAGDDLLRRLAKLFQKRLPRHALLARLGGDEFGIVLPDTQLSEGRRAADELLQQIRECRFNWEDSSFDISASIGLVPIDDGQTSVSPILSTADVACYVAKDIGRNRVHVYRDEDSEQARRHSDMRWVSAIPRALEERRFCLFQQRIIPLQMSESREHFELLIRMRDSEGNLISPGAFIPAAERYNLMPALDRWVIEESFAHSRDIMRQRTNGVSTTFGINLSGNSLNDGDMLGYIRNQIERFGIPPAMLCFEITETAAITNLRHATGFIAELRRMGCEFALDDFGSGLSSFAYLKNLPVDYLKIDGNFVKDMVDDPMDSAIVDSINGIGHALGIRTIAEFAENDIIIERLKALGVDYAQGYAIGKPQPLRK